MTAEQLKNDIVEGVIEGKVITNRMVDRVIVSYNRTKRTLTCMTRDDHWIGNGYADYLWAVITACEELDMELLHHEDAIETSVNIKVVPNNSDGVFDENAGIQLTVTVVDSL